MHPLDEARLRNQLLNLLRESTDPQVIGFKVDEILEIMDKYAQNRVLNALYQE